ncbi:hypothetical protein NDU88_008757 [Pleurodeles waltl]|uniref:Uncharacterized protein n=1 Tax=Pleurodeles waltl TaxID=8319 RepID=A0AAV7QSM7_PLEWA|nr:hypothetical protein NDU88_008757 [Pleurodeles waltl]
MFACSLLRPEFRSSGEVSGRGCSGELPHMDRAGCEALGLLNRKAAARPPDWINFVTQAGRQRDPMVSAACPRLGEVAAWTGRGRGLEESLGCHDEGSMERGQEGGFSTRRASITKRQLEEASGQERAVLSPKHRPLASADAEVLVLDLSMEEGD